MARKKRKSRKKPHFLAGIQDAKGKSVVWDTTKDTVFVLGAGIAAGFLGAALGRHSFVAGIPITAYGVYKKNLYIIAAGLGMSVSNGFQKPVQVQNQQALSTEGVDGIKEIAEQAKDRVGNFFQNFKEKLYLSPSPPAQTTKGLGEDEQVTYFVNPYSGNTGDLDMSAIDRLQEQIAQMNKPGTSGLDEMDREL